MAPATEKKNILLMFGPSGAGKSTLLKKLFAEYPDAFGFSVSHTTRKPRPGEVHGKDYHFVEREHMIGEVGAGKFIESAEFSGNMYGTSQQSVKDVLEKGKICVLDIDVQGVESLKKTPLHHNTVYVFIRPPSIEALEARLRGRNTETEESLQKRLSAALREVEYGDKPGNCDYTVVNDDLDRAYAELKAIVEPLVLALAN